MNGSIWTILLEMPGQCIYSLYEILICLNACKAMIMIQDFLYCVISNINVARQTGVARKLILESAALLFLRNISIQVALRNIFQPILGTFIKKGPRTKFIKQMLPCFFFEILSSWRSAKYVKYIHRNLLPCFSSLRGWQCKIYIFHLFPNKQLGEHIWKLHQDAVYKLRKGWRALLKIWGCQPKFKSRIQKF